MQTLFLRKGTVQVTKADKHGMAGTHTLCKLGAFILGVRKQRRNLFTDSQLTQLWVLPSPPPHLFLPLWGSVKLDVPKNRS